MKGHIEVNCWKKNPSLMPEKFKGKIQRKENRKGWSGGGKRGSAVVH